MTAGLTKTAIATWFVADKPGEETSFPQVGGQSSSIKFQNIYWRCVACFFASSLQSNPTATHLFFTNAEIPVVDGVDLAGLFRSWQVQVIHLPLTYRLPPGVSKAWGNQLYILDIIKYMAANPCSDEIIVLDSDCVWTTTAEPISKAISKYGCLTYTLNDEHYAWDAPINGVTRQEMSDALRRWTADCDIAAPAELQNGPIQYHGGEIFAATREVCCDLSLLIDSLWHWWLKTGPERCGIKEEAHFLSILYALRSYPSYTANPFIKRIWTTFLLSNKTLSDLDLAIWHVPAEKKTGFARLFREITGTRREAWATAPRQDYNKMQAGFLGIPRRYAMKFFSDLFLKLAEKGRGIFRAASTLAA